MKILDIGLVTLMTTVAVLPSCAREESKPVADDTDRLYNNILRLTSDYSDSLSVAPDSAAAKSLFEKFSHLLDSLNNDVAPDTDLLFTEAENDTMFLRIMGIKRGYEERLAALAPREEQDSLSETTQMP